MRIREPRRRSLTNCFHYENLGSILNLYLDPEKRKKTIPQVSHIWEAPY